MKVDVLVAEIGSTTTVVNAFNIKNEIRFLGQGEYATTVLEGDVLIGLRGAVEDLKKNLGENDLNYDEFFATSSAAGGLKMTVHGLVYDMTVRAAKEAALGAGAIIKNVSAGRLRRSDLLKIEETRPNIILIAGGVDYGERETALYNTECISKLNLNVPVIYAGNIENVEEVKLIFKGAKGKLYTSQNVYPKIDELNVEPTRKIIQEVFEEHIVHAPGMENIREMVTEDIIPTPGAVMECAMMLYEDIGDLMVIDVGGATTDVHSVTKGGEEIQNISISPEPLSKRTVEGDLGVYINLYHIAENMDRDKLLKRFPDYINIIKKIGFIPRDEKEREFISFMTEEAVLTAVKRHSGSLKFLYGPSGKKTISEGRDLTEVKWIIGTGGALTRLHHNRDILKKIINDNPTGRLLYPKDAKILIDNDYIMASLGVLSKKHKYEALSLLRQSFGIGGF